MSRFQDEEIHLLVELITVRPPATAEGVRFASIAVCMLLACPSLISQTEYENKCIQWLKWLSGSDSPFFGRYTVRKFHSDCIYTDIANNLFFFLDLLT